MNMYFVAIILDDILHYFSHATVSVNEIFGWCGNLLEDVISSVSTPIASTNLSREGDDHGGIVRGQRFEKMRQ